MGTTTLHRTAGMTDLEFFTKEWPTALGEGGYWKILAHNSTRDGFYAAIEDSRPGYDDHFILVVQKGWYPRSQYNFGYKDMSDTMGPAIIGASLEVINAVPPTENQYATVWREKVVSAREQEAMIKKNLKDGAVVTLKHALSFADGVSEDTFIARKGSTSRIRFHRECDQRLVRLPQGWKQFSGASVRAGS